MCASRLRSIAAILLTLACTPTPAPDAFTTPLAGLTRVQATINLPGVDLGQLTAAVAGATPASITGNSYSGGVVPDAPSVLQVINANGLPALLAIRPADVPGAPQPTVYSCDIVQTSPTAAAAGNVSTSHNCREFPAAIVGTASSTYAALCSINGPNDVAMPNLRPAQ